MKPPLPLADRLDSLLTLLPAFQDPAFSVGEVISPPEDDGVVTLPYVRYSDAVDEFVRVVYNAGWCVPFDWGSWQVEAERYVASPELLAGADVNVLTKLLTTHVRKERFCDGHLWEMAECGHLRAILERMAVLRAELS